MNVTSSDFHPTSRHRLLIWVSKLVVLDPQNLCFLKTAIVTGSFPEHKTARNFSSVSHAVDRGGLMPESGDWSVDQSPERLQPQKKIEIQKPRLSRVQLPTCVYSRHLRMVLSFAYQSLRLQLFCRHFSIDDLERSENDFERAQW